MTLFIIAATANVAEWLSTRRAFRLSHFFLPPMDSLLAAVDLGSNSFRLSIGKVVQNGDALQIYQIDRLKETVRLAAGLDANKNLDAATLERARAVLERFGERLRSFTPARVRAVATNTFRVARNIKDFMPMAEQALGFPIEIIAGREEARLIFSGVSHSLPPSEDKRLVVDIGGGSTEVIIGRGFEPQLMSSLYMGCVSYSRQFFADGLIDAYRMKQAELAARKEAETIVKPYRKLGWKTAFGSSGTAKALYAILTENGMASSITRQGLQALKARLIQDERVNVDTLRGIHPSRIEVLPGGLAIMAALFDELGVDQMMPADGALRLGVLYDLLGRDVAHDKRDETVTQFIKRYHADATQAGRIKRATLALYDMLERPESVRQTYTPILSWAASLHEVGLSIAHHNYHRHSAYILENADMPGFSHANQQLLALLVTAHQGKLSKIEPLVKNREQWLAILCLRLATLLLRRRETMESLPVKLSVKDNSITLLVQKTWLNRHPLSDFNLRTEEEEWRKIGFHFDMIER